MMRRRLWWAVGGGSLGSVALLELELARRVAIGWDASAPDHLTTVLSGAMMILVLCACVALFALIVPRRPREGDLFIGCAFGFSAAIPLGLLLLYLSMTPFGPQSWQGRSWFVPSSPAQWERHYLLCIVAALLGAFVAGCLARAAASLVRRPDGPG